MKLNVEPIVARFVQRHDAAAFRPHAEADPAFAAALRRAHPAVRILAYACRVTPCEITLSHSLPVTL